MNSRDFCYWLQGLFELNDPPNLDQRQTDLIKRHLAMVFVHEIDPSFPKEQQGKLDMFHNNKPLSAQPGTYIPPGTIARC